MIETTSIRSQLSTSAVRTPVASPWAAAPSQVDPSPRDTFSFSSGSEAPVTSTPRPLFSAPSAAEATESRGTLSHRLSMLLAASLMIGVPAVAGAQPLAAAPPPVAAISQVARRSSSSSAVTLDSRPSASTAASQPATSVAALGMLPVSSPVAAIAANRTSIPASTLVSNAAAPALAAAGGVSVPSWSASQPALLARVRGEVHLERVQAVRSHARHGHVGHGHASHGHVSHGHVTHGQRAQGAKQSGGIAGILERSAKAHGVPVDLLKAVAWKESGWNVRALSFDGHHGKGLMQIDDRYHQFARTKAAFNPVASANYGARFLAQLKRQHGSWNAALKAYNGGAAYPGQVRRIEANRPWAR